MNKAVIMLPCPKHPKLHSVPVLIQWEDTSKFAQLLEEIKEIRIALNNTEAVRKYRQ